MQHLRIATGVMLGFTHLAFGSIVYWADQDDGAVLRANLDGTGQQILICPATSMIGFCQGETEFPFGSQKWPPPYGIQDRLQ